MNNARAPDSVYASQLDDVIVNLATADCETHPRPRRAIGRQQ